MVQSAGKSGLHVVARSTQLTNRICIALGVTKIYPNAIMPFDWMHSISLGAPKSNFFEKRETGYSKFNVGKKKATPKTLVFDADF